RARPRPCDAGRAGRRRRVRRARGSRTRTVPPAIGEALARIVREGVTNAVRHAGATRVVVELPPGPDLRLRIADDGRGFDAVARTGAGHGLTGMRERVHALSGELRIRSSPGEGTELLVVLP